jgi:hypothetical protein
MESLRVSFGDKLITKKRKKNENEIIIGNPVRGIFNWYTWNIHCDYNNWWL